MDVSEKLEKTHHLTKILTLILIFILPLIGFILGIRYERNRLSVIMGIDTQDLSYSDRGLIKLTGITPTPVPTAILTPTTAFLPVTSAPNEKGWRTFSFSGIDYRFSIDYPPGWNVQENVPPEASIAHITNDTIGTVILSEMPPGGGLADGVGDEEDTRIRFEYQNLPLGNTTVQLQKYFLNNVLIQKSYLVLVDKRYILMQLIPKKEDKYIDLDSIASTFKVIDQTIKPVISTYRLGSKKLEIPLLYSALQKKYSPGEWGATSYCGDIGKSSECTLLLIEPVNYQSASDTARFGIVVSYPQQFGILASDVQECFKEVKTTVPFGKHMIPITYFYHNSSEITYHPDRIQQGKNPYDCSKVMENEPNFHHLSGCSTDGICIWKDKTMKDFDIYAFLKQLIIY